MTLSGKIVASGMIIAHNVLIPLLVDDPLWDGDTVKETLTKFVLIPLLVDDPLWV